MNANALPAEFLNKCTDAERNDVEAWWSSLSEGPRSDIAVLLDRRQDSCAYVNCPDESGNRIWRTLPIVDEDLPFDDPRDDIREWQIEYFQHLLDHPELLPSQDVVVRTFHICVNHPAARRVAADGELSCDFRCPVSAGDCPIQQFAAKVKYARLIATDSNSRRTTWICY